MSRKKIVSIALIVMIAVVGMVVATCLITGLSLETILQPKIYPIVPILPVVFFN